MNPDDQRFVSGFKDSSLKRRPGTYKNSPKAPDAAGSEFFARYKGRILQVVAAPPGLSPYVPGQGIAGDQPRTYSQAPILSGPLVC